MRHRRPERKGARPVAEALCSGSGDCDYPDCDCPRQTPREALKAQLSDAARVLEAWKAVATKAGMTAEEIRDCYSEATEFKRGGYLSPSGEATAENTGSHPEPIE